MKGRVTKGGPEIEEINERDIYRERYINTYKGGLKEWTVKAIYSGSFPSCFIALNSIMIIFLLKL